MNATITRSLLAAFALALAGSGSALAADAAAFGARMKEIAAQNSIPMDFTTAESSGDNVVLKGVVIGDATNSVGDVTFENVTGSNAEGWKVARVPFNDINTTEDGNTVSVTGMAIEGLQIAQKEGASKLPGESPYFFDSAAVAGVRVANAGKDVFTLGSTNFVNTVAGSSTIDSRFTLGNFAFDFTASGEDELAKTMTSVGYPQLTGNGSAEMSWDPKTGDTSLSPLRLTAADAGEFSISYRLGGYTPAFAKSLADIQRQMANDPQAAQSAGMAIIGLMSQLSVGSLQIGFTDDSLTNKLLDYYAKQNGTTREQLADSLSQMAPQMLAALNNPEFQTQVSTAVSTFLKDPKSIRISVDPSTPIPATQILGAAMGAPQTLPQVLQVKVTANGG